MLSDRHLWLLPLVRSRIDPNSLQVTQQDIALVDLVREAQTAAAVAEHQLPEGPNP